MQDILLIGQWVWIDYAIAGILLISAVFGLLRGFIKEAFALVTWMAAIWVSTQYSHDFSPFLQDKIANSSARIAASCAVLFFSTLILGGLISFLLGQLVQKTGLTGSDRLVGMVFGIIRGAVLVAILVTLAGLTQLPKDLWWTQSQLLPPFQSLAVWLKDHIPPNLSAYVRFR